MGWFRPSLALGRLTTLGLSGGSQPESPSRIPSSQIIPSATHAVSLATCSLVGLPDPPWEASARPDRPK